MLKVLYTFLVTGLMSQEINSARILAVFPAPSISHQVAFQPVINELSRRGHEIVVITPNPQYLKTKPPGNITEIDVHYVSYKVWTQILETEIMGTELEVVDQMFVTFKALAKVIDEQMKVEMVRDIISKRMGEFDLLITEACARPVLAFSHVYKVPLIQISSLGATNFNDHGVGALTHPIFYPIPWHKGLYKLTTWERIVTLYHHYKFQFNYNNYLAEYEDGFLREHFGPEVPSVHELIDNIQMLILNVHPLWIDNQPTPPNVIYVNGIHLKPEKPLPTELKSYLDSSKNGTIYVSFGTNAIPSALLADKLQILLKTLSQLPYDVLFKWDKDQLPIEAENIKISKWFPQADLLRHPKIKLFITQGGLQSFDEAMAAGVPLIGIPLFADQWYNVNNFVKQKIGLRLDLDSLTEQGLVDAIQCVINDKSYRENVVRLNRLMQDQPQPPLERVVWWIEHVMRHGGAAHLRAPTANMSLAHFIQLDLILLALLAICAALIAIIYIVNALHVHFKSTKIKKL